MPRRSNGRAVLSYDLTTAHARQAFEEELDLEDEMSYERIINPGGRGGTGARRGQSAAWALREDLGTRSAPVNESALWDLLEILGQSGTSRPVIESVLLACDNNFDRALEALLEMQAAGPSEDTMVGGAAPTTTDGGVPSSGPCQWDLLPEDLKASILAMLNNRDLSRVACVSTEFALRAKTSRTSAKHISIPPGMRMLGIVGMVGGHPNARSISLKQWAHTPLQEDDFTALIVAVSQGSRAAKRNTPVESISFKGCAWLTDGMVMQLCETMQHLKELCLADCKGITDMALTALAKYQRTAPAEEQEDDGGSGVRGGGEMGFGAAGLGSASAGLVRRAGSSSGHTLHDIITAAAAAAASGTPGGGSASKRGGGGGGGSASKGRRASASASSSAQKPLQRGGSAAIAAAAAASSSFPQPQWAAGDEEFPFFESDAENANEPGSDSETPVYRKRAGSGAAGAAAIDDDGDMFGMDDDDDADDGDNDVADAASASYASGSEAGGGGGGRGAFATRPVGGRGGSVGGASDSRRSKVESAPMPAPPAAHACASVGATAGVVSPGKHGAHTGVSALSSQLAAMRVDAAAAAAAGAGAAAGSAPSPVPASGASSSKRPPVGPSGLSMAIHAHSSSTGDHAAPPPSLPHAAPAPASAAAPISASPSAGGQGHFRPGSLSGGGAAGASPLGMSAGSTGGSGHMAAWGASRGGSPLMGSSPQPYGTSPIGSYGRYLPSYPFGTSPPPLGSGTSTMYGASPVMGSSPFFRTNTASTPNQFIARAATSATSDKHGRGFMSINLSGCVNISSDGVKALLAAPLSKACLLQLDISRCHRITRAALMLPPSSNLCVLRASGCNNLHEVILQLPMASPLTELSLNDCKQLSRLVVVAPALQALHVGGCRHLSTLQVRCPRLTSLTASLCFRVSEFDAEQWDAPALQRLNMFGCRHLSQPSLDMVLRASPQLRHLDVNGCNMLVALDLSHSTELRSLVVSGCKSLCALRAPSPHLHTLTARACPRLADVALEADAPQCVDLSYCAVLSRVSFPALSRTLLAFQQEQDLALQQQQNAGGGGGAVGGGGIALSGVVPVGCAVMVSQAGCERLPGGVSFALKRMRAAARAAQAAQAAAAAAADGVQVQPAGASGGGAVSTPPSLR